MYGVPTHKKCDRAKQLGRWNITMRHAVITSASDHINNNKQKRLLFWFFFRQFYLGISVWKHNQYQHSVRIRKPVMLIVAIVESIDVYKIHLFVFCLSALKCYCFVIFTSSGHSWTGTDMVFFIVYLCVDPIWVYQTRLIVTPMSETWIYNTIGITDVCNDLGSRVVQIE